MTRLHVFSALLLGTTAAIAFAQPAKALPFAFASQQITNFSLTAATGSYSIPGNGDQDTGVSTNTSTFGLLSSNSIDSKPFGTTANASEAESGAGPFPAADNYSFNAGRSVGMNGARGDSSINTGNGSSVAETEITDTTPSAAASGKGTSSWGIVVTNGTTLTFAFTDDVALDAATANPGEAADSSIATAFSITDSEGQTVFNFTPDGSGAGNMVGGTATSDPFNLQSAISSVSGFPANSTLQNSTSSDQFSATTLVLAAGNYLVHVRETSQADAQTPTVVPEPGSILLLGAGLLGAGILTRRRQAD